MDPTNNVGFFQGIGAKIDQGWENTPDTVQKLLKAPFQSFYDLGRVAVRAAQAEPVGEGEKLMEPSVSEINKAVEGVKFKDFKPADKKIPVGKGVYAVGYATTKAFVQKCHLRVNKDDSLPVKAAKVSVSGLVIGVGVLIGGSVETVTRALRATFGHDARRMYGKLGQKYHKSIEESGGAESSKKKSYDIKSEPAKFALHHVTKGLSACMPKESEVDQAKGVQNGLIGLRIAGAVVGGVIVAGAAGMMRTTRDAAVLAKHTGQEIYAQHDIPKLKISRQIEVTDGDEEPQSELEREAQSHGVDKKVFKEALGKVNRMTPKQLLEAGNRAGEGGENQLINELARRRLDAAPADVKAKFDQVGANDYENSEGGLDDEEFVFEAESRKSTLSPPESEPPLSASTVEETQSEVSAPATFLTGSQLAEVAKIVEPGTGGVSAPRFQSVESLEKKVAAMSDSDRALNSKFSLSEAQDMTTRTTIVLSRAYIDPQYLEDNIWPRPSP